MQKKDVVVTHTYTKTYTTMEKIDVPTMDDMDRVAELFVFTESMNDCMYMAGIETHLIDNDVNLTPASIERIITHPHFNVKKVSDDNTVFAGIRRYIATPDPVAIIEVAPVHDTTSALTHTPTLTPIIEDNPAPVIAPTPTIVSVVPKNFFNDTDDEVTRIIKRLFAISKDRSRVTYISVVIDIIKRFGVDTTIPIVNNIMSKLGVVSECEQVYIGISPNYTLSVPILNGIFNFRKSDKLINLTAIKGIINNKIGCSVSNEYVINNIVLIGATMVGTAFKNIVFKQPICNAISDLFYFGEKNQVTSIEAVRRTIEYTGVSTTGVDLYKLMCVMGAVPNGPMYLSDVQLKYDIDLCILVRRMFLFTLSTVHSMSVNTVNSMINRGRDDPISNSTIANTLERYGAVLNGNMFSGVIVNSSYTPKITPIPDTVSSIATVQEVSPVFTKWINELFVFNSTAGPISEDDIELAIDTVHNMKISTDILSKLFTSLGATRHKSTMGFYYLNMGFIQRSDKDLCANFRSIFFFSGRSEYVMTAKYAQKILVDHELYVIPETINRIFKECGATERDEGGKLVYVGVTYKNKDINANTKLDILIIEKFLILDTIGKPIPFSQIKKEIGLITYDETMVTDIYEALTKCGAKKTVVDDIVYFTHIKQRT